jgi:glycosyltransferase involved in cell wall biosynthesis
VVLYLGRVDPEKKVEDFVRLAARLRGGETGARFVVAGEPSAGHERYAKKLEECAEREGLLESGHLSFAGLVENVEGLLSRAAVLVIPSKREPFGLVALEAMRAGVPVVGTAGGGLDEIVVDGATGYLIRAGDTDGMVARVEELVRDPSRASRMGAEARLRFDRRFTARDYAGGLEDVYHRLME